MYLILITLLGLVTRLFLSNQSFWLDEGASLMFAKLPLVQLLESIKTDFHPPIFYALLHYWLPLAGKSEWLIRLPFIIIASATIPALYLLCREVFGIKSKVPLLSALFLSLNPLHIYYSQELRQYSLVTLLVVLSWYFLIKKKYLHTGIFNLLCLFTFYGSVFVFLSQAVYVLITRKKDFLKFSSSFLPAITVFIFWWPVFKVQLSNGEFLRNALPGWQFLSGALTLKSLLLIPLKFILGRISFQPQNIYLLIGSTLVLIFFTIAGYSLKNKKTHIFWLAFFVPLIAAVLVSLKTPVLGYWRFIFLIPFFAVLLAAGIESLPKIAYLATIAWVCGSFLFFNIFFWTNTKFQREDWREFSRFVSGKNALVVLPFSGIFAPLNFYNPDVTYLAAQTSLGKNDSNLEVKIKEATVNKDSVFVMDYLADLTDPNREILKMVNKLGYKEVGVYNFNNLGQLYQFHNK